ncbi:MAG: hypothetical protein GY743_23320 [Planctomycetaceae bacterium]|nr:hypothetical protein [Planctomycetaceae bacterium]
MTYKLNSVGTDSNDYNIINCKTEQVVGYLKQSTVTGKWIYENKELGIAQKFDIIDQAVMAIIN